MAEETTTTQTDPKLTEQQQSDIVKEYESLITAKPKPAAPEKLPTGLRYPYSTVAVSYTHLTLPTTHDV